MYVYKTTNLINGKSYIGKHNGKKCGYLGSGVILLKAIKKYGEDNFKKEILEYCNTEEELNEREKYYIKKFNACDDSMYYNIGTGGSGQDNFTHHPNKEDIRKKFIETSTGVKQSDATIQKRVNKLKGQKRNSDFKELQRSNVLEYHKNNPGIMAGKNNPMYGVSRLGKDAPMFGKAHTTEAIERMKKSAKLRSNEPYIKNGLKNRKKIVQKDLSGNVIKVWDKVTDAVAYYSSAVCDALSGRQKTSYGFLWEYYTDNVESEYTDKSTK